MSKIKRISAVLLALCMTATTAAPVFADESNGTETDVLSPSAVTLDGEQTEESITVVGDQIDTEVKDQVDKYQIEQMFADQYLEMQSEGDSEGLSLMNDALSDGYVIEYGGEYVVNSDSVGFVTITTSDPVHIYGEDSVIQSENAEEITRARISFEYTVPDANLFLHNVSLAVSCDYPTSDPDYDVDRSIIHFYGGENNLYLDGVNLIEYNRFSYGQGYAAIHIERDDDGDGSINTLHIKNMDDYNPGILYMYKRGAGAGIGSDSGGIGGTTCGRIFFGTQEGLDGTPVGPTIFAKTTQQGALIGNGVGAATYVPENIVFYGGNYYLMTNSGANVVGGASSATGIINDVEGNQVTAAGMVFLYGGTLNCNMDWVGNVIGSGGYVNPLYDDKTGGYLLYSGGSIRSYKDLNAAQMWTTGGSNTNGYGVDFSGINANVKWNDGSYDPNEFINPVSLSENSEPLYVLRFNTRLLENTDPQTTFFSDVEYPSFQVYSSEFSGNDTEIYNGTKYLYYFINEQLYKTEQREITTTYTNWDFMSNLDSSDEEHNIYLYMPAGGLDENGDRDMNEHVSITVNGESFEYEFVPAYNNNGTLSSKDSGFKLIRSWNTISGGESINEGGAYAVVDTTPGAVTINTSSKVYLMSDNMVEGVSIHTADGIAADLRLEGLQLTNNGTVLDIVNGGTIELFGDANILTGTSTSAGNPTVSVQGSLEIVKDSEYNGYSTADKLTINAADNNAGIYIGTGGSLTQNEATLFVAKKGAAGSAAGAISAEGADLTVTKGALYVASDGGDTPAIYADSLSTTYYSRITAIANSCDYAVKANDFNFNGGSIKLTGNGTTNQAAAYDIDGQETLAAAGDIACYPRTTQGLTLTEGEYFYTCWKYSNDSTANRTYLGALHECSYSSANGWYMGLSGGTVSITDHNLYIWYDTMSSDESTYASYPLFINDDGIGTITWTGSEWTTEIPVFNAEVGNIENQYPDGGTVAIDASSVNQGATVTGTVSTNDGYVLQDIRYSYMLGNSLRSRAADYTPGASPVSFSFTMPSANVTVEAIWTMPCQVTVNSVSSGTVVSGIETGVYERGSIQFTVAGDDPCVVISGTGSDARVLSESNVNGDHQYTVNVNGDTTVTVRLRGDNDGDGDVDITDIQRILTHLKSGIGSANRLAGIDYYAASAGRSPSLDILDPDAIIKSMYGVQDLVW